MAASDYAERLTTIAADSAVASRALVQRYLGKADVDVSCMCPCSDLSIQCCSICLSMQLADVFFARYDGPVDGRDRVTQKTVLKFTWCVVAKGFHEVCEVRLQCGNAIRRGVHVPQAWKGELGVRGMEALADLAVRRVRDELALSDDTKLDCRHSLE